MVFRRNSPGNFRSDPQMASSRKYFSQTARLGFSTWTKDDFPLAAAIWGDPEVTRYVGGPFSPEQVHQRLEREIESQAAQGVQYWPIFLLDSGNHVGAAGMRLQDAAKRIYAMGYYLRREFWGQGFATEAGRGVIRYAFETMKVNGLFAGHHPENHVSKIVLEKLGFRFTHCQLYAPTGLQHPSYWLDRPVRPASGQPG